MKRKWTALLASMLLVTQCVLPVQAATLPINHGNKYVAPTMGGGRTHIPYHILQITK